MSGPISRFLSERKGLCGHEERTVRTCLCQGIPRLTVLKEEQEKREGRIGSICVASSA